MRGLLLLLLAIAAISPRVIVAQEGYNETQTIERIELLGGRVWTDNDLPQHPLVRISFMNGNRFSDESFFLLRGSDWKWSSAA